MTIIRLFLLCHWLPKSLADHRCQSNATPIQVVVYRTCSKSIARNGGEVNYRGWVTHSKNAAYAKSKVECDTLILDKKSRSDTVPMNVSYNDTSQIEHEATVSNISEEQLFYLMSRGLTRSQATEMIVMGFLEPFTRELPMEYAVELNQMLKLDMSDSIG